MLTTAVRNVSDTALWMAIYRAQETERADSIFQDPFARRLAGERGEKIVRDLPFGQAMAWSVVVRTAIMDEMILRCVAQGARTVLNLGAGLDTRAYRLTLPKDLFWFDVDLPDMVAYRMEQLADIETGCQHATIAADVCDASARRRLIAETRNANRPLLVVTEGLLIYLAPVVVSNLARELHSESPAWWWITDLITPLLRSAASRLWDSQLTTAGAPFRFAPTESSEFFEPLGWHEVEFRSTLEESFRLDRPGMRLLWWQWVCTNSFPIARRSLQRMSGMALLERA